MLIVRVLVAVRDSFARWWWTSVMTTEQKKKAFQDALGGMFDKSGRLIREHGRKLQGGLTVDGFYDIESLNAQLEEGEVVMNTLDPDTKEQVFYAVPESRREEILA